MSRVLITGGNRGIGRATAAALAAAGHDVTLTSRDPRAGAAAVAALEREVPGASVRAVSLDLASFDSIRRCAAELTGAATGATGATGPAFDAVIHNAGGLVPAPERRLTADGVEETLQVHAVGPMLLMVLVGPVLARPGRMVMVTSSLHEPGSHGEEVRLDLDDPNLDRGYHPERAYKNAKLAQIWLVREWERRLGPRGLHADALSPGFVPATVAPHTRGRQRLLIQYVLPWLPFTSSVDEAAGREAHWALRPPDEPGGRYIDGDEVTEPSAAARDPDRARAFWRRAEEWIGRPIAP